MCVWLDTFGSEQEPVAGYFQHDNEFSGSIKGGIFLTSCTIIRLSSILLHRVRYVGTNLCKTNTVYKNTQQKLNTVICNLPLFTET
jgi:hypothetical protein